MPEIMIGSNKMNWNGLEIPNKPYYQDEWVTI